MLHSESSRREALKLESRTDDSLKIRLQDSEDVRGCVRYAWMRRRIKTEQEVNACRYCFWVSSSRYRTHCRRFGDTVSIVSALCRYYSIYIMQLTPWSRILPEKLLYTLVLKLPGFHGTQKFIAVFTTALVPNLSLCYIIHILYK
jgi:hypothetical protein